MANLGATLDTTNVLTFLRNHAVASYANIEAGLPRYPVCLWGKHGIGKSDVVSHLADGDNPIANEVIVLSLAEIEEMGDMLGLPIIDTVNGRQVTKTAPPDWVPAEDDERKFIIVIDDFNRADLRMIKGIMRLLLEYKMTSWKLPKRTLIMLTGNPPDDNYSVAALDDAIYTRMINVTMRPDIAAWLTWAETKKIAPAVMNFLARYPNMLCSDTGLTCPRTWAMFGLAIRSLEDLKANTAMINSYGAGMLSTEAVANFIKFVDGELEFVVEPDAIAHHYHDEDIRQRVHEALAQRRFDIINVILERLTAWIASRKAPRKGGQIHKNIVTFLEEEALSKDLKYDYINRINKGPMEDMIVSNTLTIQLGTLLRTVTP